MTSKSKGFSTRAVHAGEKRDPSTGAVITPIYETSVFGFSSTKELINVMSEKAEGYVYTRYGNPTVKTVERKMAELEGAETLATQPVTCSHYFVSAEDRKKAGITDELIRLALGIEDPEDIIADLEQAFNKI